MRVLERWEMNEQQQSIVDYVKRLEAEEIQTAKQVIEHAKAFDADCSNWQAAHQMGLAEGTLCSIREELKSARRDLERSGVFVDCVITNL